MADERLKTEAWLCGVRQGETAALAALLHHYRPRLRKMVQLRLDSRVAARVDPSDVLQDVYLDAAHQIKGYLREPKVDFYVWLRALVWERIVILQRRHLGAKCRAVGREWRLPAESSALLVNRLLAPGSSPSRAAIRGELVQRVETALTKLSADDREVILLRHFEELSNAEAAQTLGLSESGATRRYGRAIRKLRETLYAKSTHGKSSHE